MLAAHQQLRNLRDVVGFERWIILGGDHKQEFCQTELALAQDGTGLGEKFLGFALASVGNIAFTADGKKQRVHTCSIDRMDLDAECRRVGVEGEGIDRARRLRARMPQWLKLAGWD